MALGVTTYQSLLLWMWSVCERKTLSYPVLERGEGGFCHGISRMTAHMAAEWLKDIWLIVRWPYDLALVDEGQVDYVYIASSKLSAVQYQTLAHSSRPSCRRHCISILASTHFAEQLCTKALPPVLRLRYSPYFQYPTIAHLRHFSVERPGRASTFSSMPRPGRYLHFSTKQIFPVGLHITAKLPPQSSLPP